MAIKSESKLVFISHAVVDSKIAQAIVDLLGLGLGIDSKDIFCSSLQGMGIPPGSNFIDFIKAQIQTPRIVVLLLSQNYLDREFCLAELGASWAMSHQVVPIVVPPLDFSDLQSVLTGIQAFKINSADGWNDACPVLEKQLDKKANFAIWERNRNKFLAIIPDLIAKQPKPTRVSADKHEKAAQAYKDAAKVLSELSDKHEELLIQYEKVKAAKDSTEVRKIEMESNEEDERLQELIDKAADELSFFPRTVKEAFYQREIGKELTWPDGFDNDGRDDMENAQERHWLSEGSYGLVPSNDHPRVLAALGALNELVSFLPELSEGFVKWYEDEHKEKLSFTSREFWERHLF